MSFVEINRPKYRAKCGDCVKFRTTDRDGAPIGEGKGLCGALKGLPFGVLTVDTNCRQPDGVFKQKESEDLTRQG